MKGSINRFVTLSAEMFQLIVCVISIALITAFALAAATAASMETIQQVFLPLASLFAIPFLLIGIRSLRSHRKVELTKAE